VLAQIQFQDFTKETCESTNGFCPDWIADNFADRYVAPFFEHVFLTLVSVGIGFALAFLLAIVAHRRPFLDPPFAGTTTVLYTVPSIAAFFLLQPITGRGNLTAIVALVAYALQAIYANVMTGLRNVPRETVDAARGMGLTDRQILWQVEIPMAVPEILGGLRIALTTTVSLATLAFFAGGGGLGKEIYADIDFKSNVIVAGGLAVLLAAALDLIVLGIQRALTPWRRAVAA